tara:strand:- start:221 stop:418 length:198 start_codon:yes stop_codon:yes gene_type:complete
VEAIRHAITVYAKACGDYVDYYEYGECKQYGFGKFAQYDSDCWTPYSLGLSLQMCHWGMHRSAQL